jgi:hypothetical protein
MPIYANRYHNSCNNARGTYHSNTHPSSTSNNIKHNSSHTTVPWIIICKYSEGCANAVKQILGKVEGKQSFYWTAGDIFAISWYYITSESNIIIPHTNPSLSPFIQITMRLTYYSDRKQLLLQNITNHPMIIIKSIRRDQHSNWRWNKKSRCHARGIRYQRIHVGNIAKGVHWLYYEHT